MFQYVVLQTVDPRDVADKEVDEDRAGIGEEHRIGLSRGIIVVGAEFVVVELVEDLIEYGMRTGGICGSQVPGKGESQYRSTMSLRASWAVLKTWELEIWLCSWC